MGGSVGKESTSLSEHFSNLGMLHCAMIGLDLSGKTTVLYRMKFNQYMNTATTIGFNCEKVRLSNNKNYMIWDVGGQDKLRPLWRSYTRATDGIIFVVDSSKTDRFEEAKLELQKIYKSCQTSKSSPAPILILANKQDLPGANDAASIEAVLGLKELGATFWHVQATCAVTGEGLEEGMARLTEMISMKKNKAGPSRMTTSSNNLKNPPNGTTSSSSGSQNQASSSSAAGGSADTSSKSSRKVQRSHSHHY